MSEQEIARIQLALCLKEKECPECLGYRDPEATRECNVCLGSGKVPLLEGVREKCPTCLGHLYWVELPDGGRHLCVDCGRRGWVPSTDPFKYGKAFSVVGLYLLRAEKDAVAAQVMVGEKDYYELMLEILQEALTKALGVKEE